MTLRARFLPLFVARATEKYLEINFPSYAHAAPSFTRNIVTNSREIGYSMFFEVSPSKYAKVVKVDIYYGERNGDSMIDLAISSDS